jgi:murein DD-endopeptidase MepM/ murein hydrolase activator NlpD
VKFLARCALGVLLGFFLYLAAERLVQYVWLHTLSVFMPQDMELASLLTGSSGSPVLPYAGEGFMGDVGFESLSLRKHRVEEGETLSAIAGKAGISIDTVISFNRIQDARRVFAGKELRLPNQNGLLYTVRRGDSLGSIAREFSVRTEALADVNSLETAVLQPGQELFIPGARLKPLELKKILGELFIYPTTGRLTSRFGMRSDPFTGVRRQHNGIDLAAPLGTPVIAAMAGKVAKVGVDATYGKYIILVHPSGYQTWYAHLNKSHIQQGKNVAQGELIGEVGDTGYSTGPHLHFSVFKDNSPIDPFQFLR